MALTHKGAALKAATDAVTALIGADGLLVFHITGSTVAAPSAVVATLPLSTTAFGAANATTGLATANAITPDTNAAGGVVAFGSLQTSAGSAIIHFAVGDITFGGSTTVTAGDTVSCSALTYKAISA
jgi:hypothetical protein